MSILLGVCLGKVYQQAHQFILIYSRWSSSLCHRAQARLLQPSTGPGALQGEGAEVLFLEKVKNLGAQQGIYSPSTYSQIFLYIPLYILDWMLLEVKCLSKARVDTCRSSFSSSCSLNLRQGCSNACFAEVILDQGTDYVLVLCDVFISPSLTPCLLL